jgi:hypothetical protein
MWDMGVCETTQEGTPLLLARHHPQLLVIARSSEPKLAIIMMPLASFTAVQTSYARFQVQNGGINKRGMG